MARDNCIECVIISVRPAMIKCELCQESICVRHIKAHHEKHKAELRIHNAAIRINGGTSG